jgi:hypothetical protein
MKLLLLLLQCVHPVAVKFVLMGISGPGCCCEVLLRATPPTSCSLLLVALAIQEVVRTAGTADLLKILLSEGNLRVEAGDRAPPAAATMSG